MTRPWERRGEKQEILTTRIFRLEKQRLISPRPHVAIHVQRAALVRQRKQLRRIDGVHMVGPQLFELRDGP